MFDNAWAGLLIVSQTLWVVPLGVLVGMWVGAMPGLNASGMLAILLPVLIGLPPEIGLVFGVSLYAGGEVGNAYPAIMLNIPGDASAAVTAFEGYPMMLRGEGATALGISVMGSTLGAVFGGLVSLLMAPLLGMAALKFSSIEISIIILFGLCAIAQLSAGGLLKGLLAGSLGLIVGTTGTDPMWGTFRGTFGFVFLYDGIPLVAVLIGLLGFSEILKMIEDGVQTPKAHAQTAIGLRGIFRGFAVTFRHYVDVIRSSVTGLLVGLIPGAGGTVAAFVSYQQALAFASPEEKKMFGKGSVSGLIAADTANNSQIGGSMVPLLTLGIPGSSATAVLLVIMAYHNLEIGPRLFTQHGDLAYAVIWSQFAAAFLLLVVGTFLALFAYRLAYVPVNTLIPIIAVSCIMGSFAENQYVFDLGLMILFGVLGWIMKRYDYPVIAFLLGIILGPRFETHLLRGLRMGFGSPELFFTRPLAICLWVVLIATLIGPPLWRKYGRKLPETNLRFGD